MRQEITFLSGNTKEPAIPDVMNNRATAEYNRQSGWAGSSLFRLVGFKAVTVQILKNVVLVGFSKSVSYLLIHLQFSHISRLKGKN